MLLSEAVIEGPWLEASEGTGPQNWTHKPISPHWPIDKRGFSCLAPSFQGFRLETI